MPGFKRTYRESLHKECSIRNRIPWLAKLLFLPVLLFAPGAEGRDWNLTQSGKTIPVNQNFKQSTEIKSFEGASGIYGLTISGDIQLYSDSSLIRVILIDSCDNNYLVFEAFPVLTEDLNIDRRGEETSILEGVVPVCLEIEIIDASIFLKEILIHNKPPSKVMTKTAMAQQREAEKISSINSQIKKKGLLWFAGETSVSGLSYAEKKQLFGGKVPNLQGFEYYRGGIFAMPGAVAGNAGSTSVQKPSEPANDSPYTSEFSWRNRHGQDWVPPVKDQKGFGSCVCFASTSTFELLTNLYYNRHLDPDLSEQYCVSCGNCGNGERFRRFELDSGMIDEACFPYAASYLPCSDRCVEPAGRIQIHSTADIINQEAIKGEIIRGAAYGYLKSWHHAMALIGYKVLQEGDTVYHRTDHAINEMTIGPDSPYIGKTAWQFKNSWGEHWGDHGYAYVITDPEPIRAHSYYGPVQSLNYSTSDILCRDDDGDGYYTWGVGPKPDHCPACPDEPDGDDSDPCLGPMDEFGHITSIAPPAPLIEDIEVHARTPVIYLPLHDGGYTWYGNPALTRSLNSKNRLKIYNFKNRGDHGIYVTQIIHQCESPSETLTCTIIVNPEMKPGHVPSIKDTAHHSVVRPVGPYAKESFPLSIYPNPVHQTLWIELSHSEGMDLVICTLNGKVIWEEHVPGSRKQINFADFQDGIYFLHIRTSEIAISRKIIKL